MLVLGFARRGSRTLAPKREHMNRKKPGTVRIIGGHWRGRRLPVPELAGLRPSGDRSRETLFNWLQPSLRGARCADLFAGTGALGLEAASRGAVHTVLIEKAKMAARALRQNADVLQKDPAGEVTVVEGDAIQWLQDCAPRSLDIVFVDPPFGAGLEKRAMDLLAASDGLVTGGLVYLETSRKTPEIGLSPGFELLKQKELGDVRMQLLKKI